MITVDDKKVAQRRKLLRLHAYGLSGAAISQLRHAHVANVDISVHLSFFHDTKSAIVTDPHAPDAILLGTDNDIRSMIAMLNYFKRVNWQVPVIALLDANDHTLGKKLLQTGVDDYVVYPSQASDEVYARIINSIGRVRRTVDQQLATRAMLDTNPLPAIFTNKHFVVQDYNAAFTRRLRWNTRDLIGKSLGRIIVDLGTHIAKLGIPATSQSHFSAACQHADNTIGPYEITYSSVKNTHQQVIGAIWILRPENQDDQNHLLDPSAPMSSLSTTTLREVISSLTHEIRNPLATVKILANMLEHNWQQMDTDYIRKQLKTIQVQVQHITAMLEDSKNTKSSASSEEIVSAEVALEQLVSEVHQGIVIARQSENSILIVDEIKKPQKVPMPLTRQVFVNLLDNAVKYSAPQSTIQVKLRLHGSNIEIKVIDNGIGIPLADQHAIFTPYFRGSNTIATEGNGLGLFTIKQRVLALGGSVSFDSTPSQGTTFIVRIPISH